MAQEITASAFLPSVAAAIPSSSASTELTAAVSSPIRILSDSPVKVRASISRPIQSVPNKNAAEGASFLREKSVSIACPESRIPVIMTPASSSTDTAISTAVLFRRFQFPIIMSAPPPF